MLNLETELKDIELAFDELAKSMPEETQVELHKFKQEREQKKQERDALLQRCHPDNTHWPPHPECPACQKIFQKLEKEAKISLGDNATEDKIEEKVLEIFRKRYTNAKQG